MKLLRKTFTERNLVVILFVMVLVTFSFAQQDSKKLDKMFMTFKVKEAGSLIREQTAKKEMPAKADVKYKQVLAN